MAEVGVAMWHVVHIGKYYWPYQRGIETHLRLLCERLVEAVELDVIVAQEGWRTVREEINGVRVMRLGRLVEISGTSICASLPFILRRMRPEIVHVHLPNPWAEWSYFLAGAPGRLVVSFHSDIIRQKVLLRLHAPLHRRFLRRAERVIVATPRHVEHSPFLSELPAERCTVIPYGIEVREFELTRARAERAEAMRREYGVPMILFVGQLVYYKGVEVLLRAMREVEGGAVIIGRGPLEGKLRRMARELGVSDRVHFLGYVDEEELRAAYHACDVFCLPSTYRSEAFGVVQLEAFACGKPVVSTDLASGVPWVNRDGETGIVVPPGDSGALGRALRRLIEDEGLREELGRRARARVLAEFQADEMARRTLAVYEEIMRGNGMRGGE
ncbi:MAG: glycosyltransferase [bacterium]|nr:glycosyltransferase [bacterium]